MGAGASASTADANDQADDGGNDQAANHVVQQLDRLQNNVTSTPRGERTAESVQNFVAELHALADYVQQELATGVEAAPAPSTAGAAPDPSSAGVPPTPQEPAKDDAATPTPAGDADGLPTFPNETEMLVMPFTAFVSQKRICKSTKAWREKAFEKQWLVEYDESSGKVVIFVSHT